MITLAIETSGRAGSIALRAETRLLGEKELSSNGRRHARTLVPEIRTLLQEYSLSPKELELIAVSIGPGSFTGLRVGLVCAKTLAYALDCPLVGVDTFQAVAAAQSGADHLWVIEDALRGDVCAGEYRRNGTQWEQATAPHLIPFSDWTSCLNSNSTISGPGLDQWQDQLTEFRLVEESARHPAANWIAIVGEQSALEGKTDDPWTLEPFYMRRSAAEEKADAAS